MEAGCALYERPPLPPVGFPLHCTQRIKYTCFDVSKNLLVFGATSGGLYVFNREPCSFVQLIPNKEGSIIKIKISPHEKNVAFATHKGYVCICDCGVDIGSYMKLPVSQISKEHSGNEITSLIWNDNCNELYIGDDTGIVSILQTSKSFAKNVFQNPATTLMHLDSRIVQMDIRENLLLVSTFTRCFICDTVKEQYLQIGQKLRDGEFGACFFYLSNDEVTPETADSSPDNEIGKNGGAYNIVSNTETINGSEKLSNLKIFCARPGSRLWEVKTNGTVECTHQFKQLLAIPPTQIINSNIFESEEFEFAINQSEVFSAQSVCFSKLYMLKNNYIFAYKKDGIYILDPRKPSVVLWSNKYTDIIDCNIVFDNIYLWRANNNITILNFYTLEKLLLKCFVNQKFKLCAKFCAQHAPSIIESIPLYKKIYLISGLGDKLQKSGEIDLLNKVSPLLDEINKSKKITAQKSKFGIVTIENSYSVKTSSCDGDTDSYPDSPNKLSSDDNDSMLFQISPETIQVIKDFSNTVTDKLSLGTKSLKKTWDHLEDKMKKIGMDKSYNEPLDVKNSNSDSGDVDKKGENVANTSDISSQHDIIVGNKSNVLNEPNFYNVESPKSNKAVEFLYNHIKLSEVNKLDYSGVVHSFFADITCDINIIYQTIKDVEKYMISLGNSEEYSACQCGKLLLQYISRTPDLESTIDSVIENEEICSYFLQGFITINSNAQCISSCECGYPLPSTNSSRAPYFSEVLNVFIEKKWNCRKSEDCYNICKKVPYMWKKVLLLRKNEDLFNILILILQMLDEELLYTFLPQFTVETWERAVKLLVTLKRYECLNCGKTFKYTYQNLKEKSILSWDSIGALMIKSVGYQNATSILRMYCDLIHTNELTLKFYHSCLFSKLFEKYDSTVSSKLVDSIYCAYEYEDAVIEMCAHLKECIKGDIPHTALPISVAVKSEHWGLKVSNFNESNSQLEVSSDSNQPDLLHSLWLQLEDQHSNIKKNKKYYQIGMDLEQTLEFIEDICPNKDCHHCCLPLTSRVLIADGGLWVFSCGHTFHGVCLTVLKVKLCPLCFKTK